MQSTAATPARLRPLDGRAETLRGEWRAAEARLTEAMPWAQEHDRLLAEVRARSTAYVAAGPSSRTSHRSSRSATSEWTSPPLPRMPGWSTSHERPQRDERTRAAGADLPSREPR